MINFFKQINLLTNLKGTDPDNPKLWPRKIPKKSTEFLNLIYSS